MALLSPDVFVTDETGKVRHHTSNYPLQHHGKRHVMGHGPVPVNAQCSCCSFVGTLWLETSAVQHSACAQQQAVGLQTCDCVSCSPATGTQYGWVWPSGQLYNVMPTSSLLSPHMPSSHTPGAECSDTGWLPSAPARMP